MKTPKRWLAGLGLLLMAAVIGINALAWRQARCMIQFRDGVTRTDKPEALTALAKLRVLLLGVTLPRPHSDLRPKDLDPDCRILTIVAPQQVTLSAWHVDRGAQVPLVILFHAYSADKSSLLDEARAFLELGTSVLLVDFRGSGDSSESYTTLGVDEAADVEAVVRAARRNLPHSSMILFGQSMGAAAILRAVRAHAVAPDGVILEAVFDTMLNTVRNRFKAMGMPSFPGAELLVFWGGVQCGFNGFHHNPMEDASSLNCPSLFMHGGLDNRATLADGRRVFDAAAGPKSFREFPSAGHESYLARFPAAWTNAVRDFIPQTRGHSGTSATTDPPRH